MTVGLVSFCLFYMLAFPKAGFRLGGIPITVGYIMTLLLFAIALLRAARFSVPMDRLIVGTSSLLMALWSAVLVHANGTEGFSYTIAYFISLLYLPFFGLIFFSGLMLAEFGTRVESIIKWAVRFLVCYGIFLFFFRMTTGHWIEIPLLTVNIGDVGSLDDKNINRGGIFKLISTYNNGNIFGVTMCVLGPLYLRLEERRVLRILFYTALVMTLSRTVWAGFAVLLFLRVFSDKVRWTTLLYGMLGIMFGMVAIYFMLGLLGRDVSFIFDKQLGGRADQLTVVGDAALIPTRAVTAIPEIIYAGILWNFGYFGLIIFLFHLLSPSIMLWLEGASLLGTSRATACLQGLLLYIGLAASDGGYILIPTMQVFWMVAGLGLWYSANRPLALTWSPHARSG
jgi:hypothetical protein